jgi:hypothetical protein
MFYTYVACVLFGYCGCLQRLSSVFRCFFKCFGSMLQVCVLNVSIVFKHMLQVFYLNVAYVTMATYICCKHMFQMFNLF